MPDFTEEDWNRLCWKLVYGLAGSEYAYIDTHINGGDDWMDDDEEKSYNAGMSNGYLSMTETLSYEFDVDVGFRALTHAHENEVNLYPIWIADRGYSPHYHKVDETGSTVTTISDEDMEKYQESKKS